MTKKSLSVVIIVSYTYPFIGSGIGNVALKQSEFLAKFGQQVTIISSNVPKTKDEFRKNNVTFVKLPAWNFLNKFNVPVPLSVFNRQAISVIKNADIVHIHDVMYPSSFFAALIAKIYHKPIFLTQHIPYIHYANPLFNVLQRVAFVSIGKFIAKHSERIFYFNSEVANLLQQYKDKLIYLPNGIDTSFFYPVSAQQKQELKKKYSLPTNKPIVLFVGRLVPKKGYQLVHQAASDEFYTVFVGSGKIPSALNTRNCKFLGTRTPEELQEIYRLSDIFILPSHSEGYPLSVQEAMSSGLAIIVSDLQCYKDFQLDRTRVSFITPQVNAIRKTITTIIAHQNMMNQMKKYSRETAEHSFSWEKNISAVLKLYSEVAL